MSDSVINEERLAQTSLTSDDLVRYSRHLRLPELEATGQRRLKAARVLCIGAGGLSSPATLYLAAAGVGTIGIVDFDQVDLTNLQRQILYRTSDVGRKKLEAAQERIHEINPNIDVVLHDDRFTSENAQHLIASYDDVVGALTQRDIDDRGIASQRCSHSRSFRQQAPSMPSLPRAFSVSRAPSSSSIAASTANTVCGRP